MVVAISGARMAVSSAFRFLTHRVLRPAGVAIVKEETSWHGSDSAWFFTFYSFIWAFLFFKLIGAPWIFDSSAYWVQQGMVVPPIPTWLKIIYHLQFAQYVSATLFLLFGWTSRMPQHEKLSLLVHHLVQIFLVGFSFSVSEHRMGSIIMLIHDMCSPIFEASNVARYIGWTELSNMLYMIYALVYLVTRMIALPIRVILAIPMHFPPSIYYAFTTCGHPAAQGGCLAEPLFTINYYYIWICLLILLYLTHLHWSVFIARSAKISLYAAAKEQKSKYEPMHSSPDLLSSSSTATTNAPDSKPKVRKLANSQRAR